VEKMKTYLLYVSIALAAGITFVNIYNSLVDVPSWGSDIPNSIIVSRSYFKVYNPGMFFKLISPLNQITALACLILCWKTPSLRMPLATALGLYILGNIFTFLYFHRRNSILFDSTSTLDRAVLEKIWGEWHLMTWLRTSIVFAGLILSMISLHRSYRN
jgi:hypothetical protein